MARFDLRMTKFRSGIYSFAGSVKKLTVSISTLIKIYFGFIRRLKFNQAINYLNSTYGTIVGDDEFTNQKLETNEYIESYYRRSKLWGRANALYQSGQWADASQFLLSAATVQDNVLLEIGLENNLIRFIGSEITSSIGHMAIALGLRARLDQIEGSPNRFLILAGKSANDNYLQLWKKHFPIIKLPSSQVRKIEIGLWPFFENVQTVKTREGQKDLITAHNFYARKATNTKSVPLLEIPFELEEKGEKLLKSWGWGDDDWFVTLHVRENRIQGSNYGRNASPKNYELAVKRIIECGGKVVRIGDAGSTPLRAVNGFVDLTRIKNRESWLDVYLLAKCKFHLGTTSGPLIVPQTFGKPVLATNAPDIGKFVYLQDALVIPKRVKTRSGRIINFSEQLRSEAATSDGYINRSPLNGFEWVENSPEEIEAAVIEILNGSYRSLTPNQQLVMKMLNEAGFDSGTPIAASFIANNPAFFG